jgi:hypothetical protein
MAQGKAFTKEQKDVIIQSLKDSLELGFSRAKSCKMIGLAEGTLSNWVKADEALGMKLQNWENAINRMAMSNLQQQIASETDENDKKKETTKWWAERKMKNDFSLRTETMAEVITDELSDERKEAIRKALLD